MQEIAGLSSLEITGWMKFLEAESERIKEERERARIQAQLDR